MCLLETKEVPKVTCAGRSTACWRHNTNDSNVAAGWPVSHVNKWGATESGGVVLLRCGGKGVCAK